MEDDIQKFKGAKYLTNRTPKQAPPRTYRGAGTGRRPQTRPDKAHPTTSSATRRRIGRLPLSTTPRPSSNLKPNSKAPHSKISQKLEQRAASKAATDIWAGSLRREDWKLHMLLPNRRSKLNHKWARAEAPGKLELRRPYDVYRQTFSLDTPAKEKYYFDKKAEQFYKRLSFTPTAPM